MRRAERGLRTPRGGVCHLQHAQPCHALCRRVLAGVLAELEVRAGGQSHLVRVELLLDGLGTLLGDGLPLPQLLLEALALQLHLALSAFGQALAQLLLLALLLRLQPRVHAHGVFLPLPHDAVSLFLVLGTCLLQATLALLLLLLLQRPLALLHAGLGTGALFLQRPLVLRLHGGQLLLRGLLELLLLALVLLLDAPQAVGLLLLHVLPELGELVGLALGLLRAVALQHLLRCQALVHVVHLAQLLLPQLELLAGVLGLQARGDLRLCLSLAVREFAVDGGHALVDGGLAGALITHGVQRLGLGIAAGLEHLLQRGLQRHGALLVLPREQRGGFLRVATAHHNVHGFVEVLLVHVAVLHDPLQRHGLALLRLLGLRLRSCTLLLRHLLRHLLLLLAQQRSLSALALGLDAALQARTLARSLGLHARLQRRELRLELLALGLDFVLAAEVHRPHPRLHLLALGGERRATLALFGDQALFELALGLGFRLSLRALALLLLLRLQLEALALLGSQQRRPCLLALRGLLLVRVDVDDLLNGSLQAGLAVQRRGDGLRSRGSLRRLFRDGRLDGLLLLALPQRRSVPCLPLGQPLTQRGLLAAPLHLLAG